MPASGLGIDPTRVDTTKQYSLGYEVGDPRSQDFPGNTIRYVLATADIAAGDSVQLDVTDNTNEPWAVKPVDAVKQPVVGIAHVAIGNTKFGWITTKGRVASAKAGPSVAAGARLKSSASAGKLVALTQADSNFTSNIYDEMVAAAAGVGIIALDANDSNANPIEVFIS